MRGRAVPRFFVYLKVRKLNSGLCLQSPQGSRLISKPRMGSAGLLLYKRVNRPAEPKPNAARFQRVLRLEQAGCARLNAGRVRSIYPAAVVPVAV